MPLLDQVYYNASDAFANDPALRELLRSTMDQASMDTEIGLQAPPGTPGGVAPGGIPQQMPNSPAKQDALTRGMPELRAVNGSPVTPEEITQRMATQPWGGGTDGPMQPPSARPQVASAPPQRGPGIPGGIPGQRAPAAVNAAIPDVSRGNSLTAFLSGLGQSDAILPAIGGGMQAMQDLETANKARNQTLRALINRGLDQDTAMAAISNPEILRAVLPTLFGGNGGGDIEEIYDEATGLPRKVLRTKDGRLIPVGGLKRDNATAALSKAQQTANIKRVESYKNDADTSREIMTQLATLKELRKDVGYEGMPLAPMIAKVFGWTGLFSGGAGAALAPSAATLQLGFTNMTKGAISDAEMGLFASATPGIEMNDEAAGNVMTAMEAGAKRVQERSKFYEKWLKVNNGDLVGAQEAWDNYVATNPIIAKDVKGIKVNPKNIANWQDYVTTGGEAPPAPPVSTEVKSGTTQSAAPSGRPMPNGGIARTPHDTGEAVPGMMELKDGSWVMPDPTSPTGFKKWRP